MVAIYQFQNFEYDNLVFLRLSKPRVDADNLYKLNKFFNNCEILEPSIKEHNYLDSYWNMKCHCGKIFKTKLNHIKYKQTKISSCGCILKNKNRERSNYKTFINKEVKKCLILKPSEEDKISTQDSWDIKCFCGKIFNASLSNFIYGTTSSCGCFRKDKCRKLMLEKHKKRRVERGLKENQYIQDFDDFLRNTIFNLVKKIIIKIDKNVCCLCLRHGHHIHHIDPIRTIESLQELKDFYLVYDLNNLITLCEKCHKEAHGYSSKNIDDKIQILLKEIVSMRFIDKNIYDQYLNVKKDIERIILTWLEENYV